MKTPCHRNFRVSLMGCTPVHLIRLKIVGLVPALALVTSRANRSIGRRSGSASSHRSRRVSIRPTGRFRRASLRTTAASPEKSRARKTKFSQPIQPDLGRPDLPRKIIRFVFPQINGFIFASRPDQRGVRVVTDVGPECGGRESVVRASADRRAGQPVSDRGAPDERCNCGRRSRVVLAPRRWR
jgi:hypothetical protein